MYLADGPRETAVPCCAASAISPPVARLRDWSGTPPFGMTQANPSLTVVIVTETLSDEVALEKYGTSHRYSWRSVPGAGWPSAGTPERTTTTAIPAAIFMTRLHSRTGIGVSCSTGWVGCVIDSPPRYSTSST